MLLPQEISLKDVDQFTVEAAPGKHTVLRLGLSASFYLANPQGGTTRKALAQCGDHYLQLAGDKIKCWDSPEGLGNIKALPAALNLEALANNYSDPKQDFTPRFFGDKNPRSASAWGLEIFSANEDSLIGKKPAYLSFVLPFHWLENNAGGLQKLMLEFCKILQPIHAYAGVAAIQSLDFVEKQRSRHHLGPLAKRFPGLDIDNPGIISNHMGNESSGFLIKGIGWLTAISKQLLEKIGSVETFSQQLDDGFIVSDYGEGLLVQAGYTPQLGDVNRQIIPRNYKKLSDLLRPLRMTFPEGDSLLQGSEGISNTEASNAWLARFDDN